MVINKKILLSALLSSLIIFGASNANAVNTHSGLIVKKDNISSSIISIKSKDITDEEKKIISEGAQNFIQSMAQRALDFLADETKTDEEKIKAFEKILNENFDMKTIGRFSLGRYWRSSSLEEKKEYIKLFTNMVTDMYSERFAEYKGQKLETTDSRMTNKRDTLVLSEIIPETNKPIKVDWLVRYKNNKYKVVDVIVEGISMALTQRQEFAAVIQRGGGKTKVLIDHLKPAPPSSDNDNNQASK